MSSFKHLMLPLVVSLVLAGCATQHTHARKYSMSDMQFKTVSLDKLDDVEKARAVELKRLPDVAGVAAKMQGKRVVFVGEQHDRLDHHLNQLDIIKALYAVNPNIAIGMEYFQQPYQQALDDYIAGKIDEKDFVRKSQYFEHWDVDYRMLRPIFQFAREKGIPLVALNIDGDLHRKYVTDGVDKLTAEEKAKLPSEIDRSDTAYIDRLKKYFVRHPGAEKVEQQKRIERWVNGQLLWDEYMAQRASDYLKANPQHTMVVLAGAGHIAFGSGIPKRVNRRVPADYGIVINGIEMGDEPEIADFVFLNRDIALANYGRLGVDMDKRTIKEFGKPSAAQTAGLAVGDEIVELAGQPINDFIDLKFALIDRKPGEVVGVTVTRKIASASAEQSYQVTLQ